MADKPNRQQSHSTPKQQSVISLLRLPEVKRRTGLSRSTIYLAISQGKFPKSVNLGERSVAWSSADIDKWIADRIAASEKKLGGSYGI